MRIAFTVTNDLNYDQRMIRICTTLSEANYDVILIGRKKKESAPLNERPFKQKRLNPFFQKGPGFYVEYNIRLFFYLLFHRYDVLCAIDLDTIVPVYFCSVLKGTKRVYDAHEYFTGMIEILRRPLIYKIWLGIEKFCLPRFKFGYTVNQSLAQLFKEHYNVDYSVIRNVPVMRELKENTVKKKRLIYSGSVNEGRGFEQLIPAMRGVDCGLDIYGNGNFYHQVEELIRKYKLENKVILKGYISPEQLFSVTQEYYAGITLFENTGFNQYLSLANRFFDYMQNGIPQLCVGYPEYKVINDQFEVAVLINELIEPEIVSGLKKLLEDVILYNHLVSNCMKAREVLNWQNEQKRLLQFYKEKFG